MPRGGAFTRAHPRPLILTVAATTLSTGTEIGRPVGFALTVYLCPAPLEVKNALRYVLHNGKKHGHEIAVVDRYSSGPWFDGWKEGPQKLAGPARFVMVARTWLLSVGWRRHGLISLADAPAA